MKDNLYIILYLFSNLFRTFDVYLFYESFYTAKKEVKLKKICYISYYLVVAIEYVVVDIPILTLLLNVIGLIALTFLYQSNMKRRILGAGFILALLSVAEAIIMILTGYLSFSFFEKGFYSSEVGVVSIPILTFMFVLVYKRVKQHKTEILVPISYWVAVIIVPISCIYIVMLSFGFGNIKAWQILSIVIIMFAITVCVFMLYEKQLKFFQDESEKKLLEVKNSYYEKQLDYMMTMENVTRSLRHDMKNHLISISGLAQEHKSDEILDYVKNIYEYSKLTTISKVTENVVVDSVLNSKVILANDRDVVLEIDATIAEPITISAMDITILLGNILDNAIENAEKTEQKTVRIDIKCDKGRLLIYCENSFDGTLKRKGNYYYTLKSDKKTHGFGIQNMKNVVDKYKGTMEIQSENNVFKVDILLYI